MAITLQHIATIHTGVFARPGQEGDIAYLQVRHFDEAGNRTSRLLTDLPGNPRTEKHLLQQGDVLFAAKGAKNFAACFEENGTKTVASTSFFVIRLQNGAVLPAYLAWFLNHPQTLARLKRQAKGSAMASIPKTALAELEIPVPARAVQERILKVAALRQRERQLQEQIQNLKEKKLQYLLHHIVINETEV